MTSAKLDKVKSKASNVQQNPEIEYTNESNHKNIPKIKVQALNNDVEPNKKYALNKVRGNEKYKIYSDE